LYDAVGFTHVPVERVTPSPYARADVYLEMWL
jgi:putative acetyltransferase